MSAVREDPYASDLAVLELVHARFLPKLDPLEDISFQVEDITAEGERVLALFTLSAHGPTPG